MRSRVICARATGGDRDDLDATGASVTLTNSYTAISRELVVTKTVVKVGDTDVAEEGRNTRSEGRRHYHL